MPFSVIQVARQRKIRDIQDVLSGALMHCWDELKFNDRIDQVLGSEFAGSAVGTLLSSSNGIARMAGRLVEGDYEGAAEELGCVMQNTNPMVELGTKGARVLGAYINTGMTYWKSNKLKSLVIAAIVIVVCKPPKRLVQEF